MTDTVHVHVNSALIRPHVLRHYRNPVQSYNGQYSISILRSRKSKKAEAVDTHNMKFADLGYFQLPASLWSKDWIEKDV